MSEVIEKARRATKLQASNYFIEFLTEAQDKQIAVFLRGPKGVVDEG